MSNVIYFVSYKLKKGVSVQDFLDAAQKLNDEHISKQPGYLSWTQAVDGETWADIITFETMDDLDSFQEVSKNPCDLALQFYSYINLNSCKVNMFSVERTYEK